MDAKELRHSIANLLLDIEFQYKGKWGAICPFSRGNIAVKYGDLEKTFDSVDALMTEPFIDGKPLAEICENFIV